MKISVHIIAKEDTNLGRHFIDSCLTSIVGYADELILIDNGCSSEVKEVIQKFCPYFPSFVYKESKLSDFASLRNECLKSTGSDVDYFHWIDTDEIWFPVELVKLKSFLQTTDANRVATNLIHFMGDPFHFQEIYPKFNIFKMPKDRSKIKWRGGVHESLDLGGKSVNTAFNYLHFGYCREQWRICLRWLHYAILEFGNVNCYRQYNDKGKTLDYFTDQRTPDQIIDDRVPISHEYSGGYPSFVEKWIRLHEVSNHTWDEWLKKNDDQSFWLDWQELREQKGNWKDTLKDIVAKMGWKEKL